jgi:hypothetical protein
MAVVREITDDVTPHIARPGKALNFQIFFFVVGLLADKCFKFVIG